MFVRKNRNELSSLLNLPVSLIKNIKSIEAEGLYRVDADNRQNPISKFEIKLKVYDPKLSNKWQKDYYTILITTHM